MCFEYLTVTDVRDEFGDDVASLTDAQIQKKIDRLAAQLEDQLGHTFGRALTATTTGSDSVQVTATALVIGGATYLFATYTTLGALLTAVNAAGDSYRLALLPRVAPDTPSTLLAARASVAIGARAILCLSAYWLRLSGDGRSHLFLPLPVGSVTEVTENLTTLAATDYWAIPGESWLIRKLCTCSSSTCQHPRGSWSLRYPGNITVTYVPSWWIGGAPAALGAVLLEAMESGLALGPMQSESFGEYSYTRGKVRASADVRAILGGSSAVRQYAIRWAP